MQIIRFIFFFFYFIISIYSVEERYSFGTGRDFIITKEPAFSGFRAISKEFIPESTRVLSTAELRTEYSDENSQFFVLMESELNLITLATYYELLFKTQDWKVLQRESKEKSFMSLTESRGKKILTVFIQDKGDYRKIKLFYKRSLSQ